MGGSFGGEIRGEGFGVGYTGQVRSFEEVLVVGFRSEEKGGSFGADDC